MEFHDAKQIYGNYAAGRRASERINAFEIRLTEKEENDVIILAMKGLALNLMSNATDGVGPINANLLVDYLENYQKNPYRLTYTPNEAARFAQLLRLGAQEVLGQQHGEKAREMAAEIEQEAAVRPFLRKLNETTVDDLFQ